MTLTIGQLAKNAEVTIETIRYYQRKGLLQEPDKPLTGYRHYPIETIAQIKFIKSAQQAGFTLKEILQLLSLDDRHCDAVRKLAAQKCQQIDKQITNLISLRNRLDALIKNCPIDSVTGRCSLIDSSTS